MSTVPEISPTRAFVNGIEVKIVYKKKFGSPPMTAEEWMLVYAETCYDEARATLWPWSIKYKWRGDAFKEAAELVNRGSDERGS